MNLWLKQHVQACKQVLARLSSNSLSTLLIALVIGVTLALPVVLYTALDNVNSLAGNVKKESKFSVFLAKDTDESTINALKSALEKNTAVKHVQFVPKDEALKQLAATNANEDIINSLEENPLPDAFFIEPNTLDPAAIDTLRSEISQLAGVEQVILDGTWIKRLNYLLSLGKKVMWTLAALIGFALFAVIGNTIRMQILTQRAEIELSRLIGATNTFIRRPFLYAGALYGLFGGLLALSITCAVLWFFNTSIATLAAEYQSNFSLGFPTIYVCLATCLLAIFVGLISSAFTVSQTKTETIR